MFEPAVEASQPVADVSTGAPRDLCCTNCGLQAPTRFVTFRENIGFLLARSTSEASGHFCRRCIGAYFRSYTLTTLCLGWWGTISLFITPVFILGNLYHYLKSIGLPPPDPLVNNLPLGTKPAGVKVGSVSTSVKIVYGLAVWAVLAGIIAFSSVGWLEQHAPWVNAKLHGGEISQDSDADYALMKAKQDLDALSAEVKVHGWQGFRGEYLGRESYLTDLKAQNAKIQRAAVQDRASSPVQKGSCDDIILNEYLPALDKLVTAIDREFAFAKANSAIDDSGIAAFNQLSDNEIAQRANINHAATRYQQNGCKK